MLNINIEGSRDYFQHFQLSFHVFQSFSLSTKVSTRAPEVLFQHKHQSLMCSKASRSTQNINYSCAPEILAQHKTSHQSCASGFIPNKNKDIYTSSIIGLHPIYKTNHHVHMQWDIWPNITINIKIIIIINSHLLISARSKIWDITSLHALKTTPPLVF